MRIGRNRIGSADRPKEAPIMLTLALVSALCSSPTQDPIPRMLKGIEPARLKASVETLVSFGTRHSASDTKSETTGIGAARRWIRDEFHAISKATGGRLEVHEQHFTATARGLGEVDMVNVYGFLPGTSGDPLGRTYVVSGHYDSRAGSGSDSTSLAPGADDDGSGTAVVLELARVMSAGEYSANLVFICVAGEEQGLHGAKHFAEWAAETGLQVDGMITNDIVGNIHGGNGIIDDKTVRCFSGAEGLHSTSRELARAIGASARRYVPEANLRLIFRLDRFGRGGDHIPFHESGVPAVRLSEANENYARQHQDLREVDGVEYGDVPEWVSADYMARVARVNAAALAEWALAPPAPEQILMRAAVSYDTQLSWSPVDDPSVAGYEIVWRDTTAPDWQETQAQGPESSVLRVRGNERPIVRATIKGITADGAFFGVRSVSKSGHRSRVCYPERP